MVRHASTPASPVSVSDILSLTEMTADIIQLGAVTEEGDQCFSQHIHPPSGHIPAETSAIHGITLQDGRLYRGGAELAAIATKEALQKFLGYLQKLGSPIILVGHNIDRFDKPVLCETLKTHCPELIDEYNQVIYGTLDTLTLSRVTLDTVPNHSLATLIKEFLPGDEFDYHDALGDCQALQKLFSLKFKETHQSCISRVIFVSK